MPDGKSGEIFTWTRRLNEINQRVASVERSGRGTSRKLLRSCIEGTVDIIIILVRRALSLNRRRDRGETPLLLSHFCIDDELPGTGAVCAAHDGSALSERMRTTTRARQHSAGRSRHGSGLRRVIATTWWTVAGRKERENAAID